MKNHQQRGKTMKRIVLFLDGTWNEDNSDSLRVTNIVRLRQILAHSLEDYAQEQVQEQAQEQAQKSASEKPACAPISSFAVAGIQHYVYYDTGVGTDAGLDRLKGGMFGIGISKNIRQAYKFLSFYYEEGDEVYIFGFSRGAYTARTLAGYVFASGLLRRDLCTQAREEEAWTYYRTPKADRLPGAWAALQPDMHPKVRVKCLGVFDTVGALGVPVEWFKRFNTQLTQFHDVTLNTNIDVNLHALAIDEQREAFQAAPWKKPQFKHLSKEIAVEQVWFTGVHTDIGGGYVEHGQGGTDSTVALDDLSLNWMIQRVRAHTDLPLSLKHWKTVTPDFAYAAQHDSRSIVYKAWAKAIRSMNNRRVAEAWHTKVVGADYRAEPLGEMVHISALERLGRRASLEDQVEVYVPENLKDAFFVICHTYKFSVDIPDNLLDALGNYTMPIVGWDGTPCKTPQDFWLEYSVLKTAQAKAAALKTYTHELAQVYVLLSQVRSRLRALTPDLAPLPAFTEAEAKAFATEVLEGLKE
jgi:uncharacterized protein (DUF2235 family)